MDIDSDGYNDVLSGSWPGEVFLFKGGPNHIYADRKMLTHKDGEPINVGGGVEEGGYNETGTLIRGTVEWETTDEGTFAVYHGQRIKSTPEKPIASTGTASTVHPADWDSDGDYDLIVGDIGGGVHLIPNEGSATAYAFGKESPLQADGKNLRVASRAGPFAADWDGDGDLDLLVGADDGSVTLYRNTGSATAPRLAAGKQLVSAGSTDYSTQAPRQAVRGSRAKVCVADWNNDGKPDLLVGDLATQRPDRPEPTPEQEAEFERMREQFNTTMARYQELAQQVNGPDRPRDEAALKRAEEELTRMRSVLTELQSQLPRDYETHGWVWLFLRQ